MLPLYFFKLNNFMAQCDRPEAWQLGFQDPASPISEGIINLHHDVMAVLLFVLGVVSVVMLVAIYSFNANNYKPGFYYTGSTHNTQVEFIWTLIPCLILLLIAAPSFKLIFSLDDVLAPQITVKVMGHQWYWTYEYSNIADDNTPLTNSLTQQPKNFDSYMIKEEDLVKNAANTVDLRVLRLLEVDQRLVLPWGKNIRFLISSADVLHSWSIPSLGVKIDACPGRLNQVNLFLNRPGVFYGQCSEICGVNHAFMPICIETN